MRSAVPLTPGSFRGTRDAGKKAGPQLQVLDESAPSKVKQGTAAEIFLDAKRS
jgi:hypothetical protein